MASNNCTCIYCKAVKNGDNYIDCTHDTPSCCCDWYDNENLIYMSDISQYFMWSITEFVILNHGKDYAKLLEYKIDTYIQSLIDNYPFPNTYLDSERTLGCHIKKYIVEYTEKSANFTSIILDNNLSDDTVRAVVNLYGYVVDLSIECIKRGKMDYLAHYYKNIEPENNDEYVLKKRLNSIIRFITINTEFNTDYNITKLREIYGNDNFDKAMIIMFSSFLRPEIKTISLNNLSFHISIDNLPSNIKVLNYSSNPVKPVKPITSLRLFYGLSKKDFKEYLEVKIFKNYYNNYIKESNLLHSLLIDDVNISDLCEENASIMCDIETAITMPA